MVGVEINNCTCNIIDLPTQAHSVACLQVFFELQGSIILSACLIWDFVACLAIILLIHYHGQFEVFL